MKKIGLILLVVLNNLFGYSGYYAPFEGTQYITQGWEGTYSHGGTTGSSGVKLAYALDIGIKYKNVLAVKDGEIIYAQNHKNFGKTIIIKHNDGLYSLYAHLSELKIINGQVKKGNVIAISGYTGAWKGTGAHLHFQILTQYLGDSESNINSLSAQKYTTTIDFQGFSAINVNQFSGNKYVTSKNTIAIPNITHSIFDGAGSLVNPNKVCFGCNQDTAKMHPHNGENSTVVFQWYYDENSCSKLDIVSENSIGDVLIRAKAWDGHITKTAIKVKLDKDVPISFNRADTNSNWTTFAITTTKPLTTSNKIDIVCKTPNDTFKNGVRSTVTKDLIGISRGYFWTGTGSIISQTEQLRRSGYGISKDLAVTFNSHKSLTSFQWDTTSCHKIVITSDRSEDNYVNNVIVDKKYWNFEAWEEVCTELPCKLYESATQYFILKVKSDSGVIDNEQLQVKCID